VHLLLALAGEAAPRRLRLEPSRGVVALPLPGRPTQLRWAAGHDLPGRLALLEAAPGDGTPAERIAALEAGAPLPMPGEAGRWAARLAP